MSKEIYISSTPHETRLAIVENDALTEIYYERENEYTLAGSIYNGKVTRVLPGMQSAFVEIGLERDAFLYITDFLEEAPDSAEFDTAGIGDGGSREPRIPRLEGSAEPARSETQRTESPRSEGSRSEGRGERSGRGRRGRGDRHAQATPSFDRPAAPETHRLEAGTEFPSQAWDGTVDESVPPILPGEPADTAELGEGAPGADGSRRWRGRRGRRRGRGPGAPAGSAPRSDTPEDSAPPSASAEYPLYPAEAEAQPIDPFANEIFDGAAESVGTPDRPTLNSAQPRADASDGYNDSSRSNRESREARGDRNNRGDRGGRDRGRNDRGGRADRNDRTPRAPRGFTPSQALYGVEEVLPDAPIGDPIILPGESLSKYRKGEENTPSRPLDTVATPAHSTEFSIVAGWDGGSVLPGESLSRHRRAGGQDQPRAQHKIESRIPFAAPSTPPVPVAYAQVLEEEDGPSIAVTPETQPEVALTAHPERVPAPEISHESTQDANPTAEYEPHEASASFRVDPVAPREYRQSSSVAERPTETTGPQSSAAALEAGTEQPGRAPASLAASEPAAPEPATTHEPAFGQTHLLTPSPTAPLAPLVTTYSHAAAPLLHEGIVPHGSTSLPTEDTAAVTHDITTLSSSGEMVSDAPSLDSPAAPSPQEQPEPTSPMHHETAIVENADASDLVEERADLFEEEEEAPAQIFAPGQGDLEEELLDDEEYDIASLHAAHDDENEDTEEETLEGAADLGTMLREMSIDQITRAASPPEDDLEEEDFEEDFLEESEEIEGGEREIYSSPNSDPYSDAEEEEEGSEAYARTAEATGDFSTEFREPAEPASTDSASSPERRNGRRDRDPRRSGGREGSRDRDRRGGDSSGRPRNTGGGGDRERGRSGGRTGRGSMQTTNLPAISELLKPGQEILVQIAKEPIAKKGARITSHIALPGRFLVFMPTVNHTGVSRKIESDGERRRLKEILLSEKGEAAGGFIVRTAASGASEEELRSDLRFLLNLWTDIKQRSESSKSPALIYHDLNLVERILRDQVTDTFSAIWVDTETEYERVLRFLQRFQPSLIRRVKLYGKETPLFEQFGITEEINKALRSKVWLKSGGSIVINQTEALVAIDINTGKFVGKTARLEDTIVKTNLDAIPEIVRQIRLRDLGGIIIIDFIDMDERKNRNKVMAALEEELKSDRAPSKVLQFNDFGLVAITRKRVKQSLERTLSTTCNVCVGTGMVKSPVTVCNDIYIEMRKMVKHLDKGDVMLRVHPEVVKQLKSPGTKWLQEMEEISGKTILVKSDPSLHPEQFDIH